MQVAAILAATTGPARVLVTYAGRMASWHDTATDFGESVGARGRDEDLRIDNMAGHGERYLVGSPRIWVCFV